jgi:hypothetical protein
MSLALILALLGAWVQMAATPPDAAHAAVARALGADAGGACSHAEVDAAVARADVRQLGTVGGDPVILAAIEAPCICGNVNCPWYVLRVEPSTSQVLLSTFAFAVNLERSNGPLPNLRERSHDSALITDETVDAFRNGHYVTVGSYRVRGDTGARKPDTLPVTFTPGASSARLSGTIMLGWDDAYVFDATKGQRLTIDDVSPRTGLALELNSKPGSPSITVHPGTPVVLPLTSSYRLRVGTGSERDAPYALTLAIR